MEIHLNEWLLMHMVQQNEGLNVLSFDAFGRGVGFIFLPNLKGKFPWKHRENEIGNVGKKRTRGNNEIAIKP